MVGRAWRTCLCLVAATLCTHALAAQETLVVDFMVSSGAERSAWYAIIQNFQKRNPDVRIIRNEYDPESYKHDFPGRIVNERADIAFWFAGERLRDLARHHALAPLDADFVESSLKPALSAASIETTRVDQQVYGLPIAYYPWGFFYRKSLFQRLSLAPPDNWNDLLALCEKLKHAGITPFGLADGDGWPAAGWFDLLDLRINGLDFHRRLLAGEIPFDDPQVHAVYDQWKSLLDQHDFLDDVSTKPWVDVMPYLYREKIGMVLMGSFISARLPPDMASDIGFFRFPTLTSHVADYEDTPIDVLVLPAGSRHHTAAMRFLAFLVAERQLDQLNDITHTFSPRIGAQQRQDEVSKSEKKVLDAAAGYALFFDRDADQSVLKPGLDSFQRLMAPPHDLNRALEPLAAVAAKPKQQ